MANTVLFCCQMAEHALSQELLCSDGGRSVSYLLLLAQLQLLKADYCSAAASLREALFHRDQVLTQTAGCNAERGLGGKCDMYGLLLLTALLV